MCPNIRYKTSYIFTDIFMNKWIIGIILSTLLFIFGWVVYRHGFVGKTNTPKTDNLTTVGKVIPAKGIAP